MTPQSAKAKGRALQQWVRDKILSLFPALQPDDVRSTSMGAGGEDIQLSPLARGLVPYSIECKNRKALKSLYDWYEQAKGQNKGEPLVVIKANYKKPLAIVDAEHFFNLLTR